MGSIHTPNVPARTPMRLASQYRRHDPVETSWGQSIHQARRRYQCIVSGIEQMKFDATETSWGRSMPRLLITRYTTFATHLPLATAADAPTSMATSRQNNRTRFQLGGDLMGSIYTPRLVTRL